ncbi:tail-anchored protein insertion receptor WRB isoform X2 [Nasonia vitripennis]|uniref:Guided entry of tail-anchored proteins factor 1 n=1 Tax=Nasonia vitripennis TaxID=7425 RepID=A0A7M7G0S9_NASVI|nr:tail-anchored protein insertion receptor WRB isoform X2 [Nasonia vitripennis]
MSLLILATSSCVLDIFVACIVKIVISWFFLESNEEQILRKDLINTKKEMNSISIVDEFSKYAKLQRKYIKLQAIAKQQINARSTSKFKLELFLTYGAWIINGIFASVLLLFFRKDPVLIFPTGYLWPLEPILSWPTQVAGGISLPAWIVLVKLTISSNYRMIIL